MDTTTAQEPVATGWGGGSPVVGTPFRVVIDPSQTDGALVGLSAELGAGHRVAAHVHDDAVQIVLVISGTVGCRVDGVEHVATAGAVVVIPRGAVHELWNRAAEPARVVDLYTPPGIERFFAAVGAGEARHDD